MPKQKSFNKYIKGKKQDKYNKELVKIIADHYQIAKIEAEEYISLLEQTEISSLLKKYGKSEKEIKGLLK